MPARAFFHHICPNAGTFRRDVMLFYRALWFAFLLTFARASFAAGTVSLGPTIQWAPKAGDETVLTRDANTQNTATLPDCQADRAIKFVLNYSGDYVNASTQAWVGGSGADCTQQTQRTGSGTQTCWRVSEDLPRPADTAARTTWIRVRDIMSQDKTKADQYVNASEATACKAWPQTNLTLYFLTFDNGAVTPAVSGSYSITIDTQGPTPPTGLTVKPGNQRLYVSFTPPTAAGQNIALANVYCALSSMKPVESDAGAKDSGPPDAGGTSDAGIDDAGTSDASTMDAGSVEAAASSDEEAGSSSGTNCNLSSLLKPGDVMPAELPAGVWLCGQMAVSSIIPTSVEVTKGPNGTKLENGAVYTVGISFVDTVKNVGALSELACGRPEATVGFYENYLNAGGDATGCSTTHGGSGYVGALALLGLVLVIKRRMR